MAKYESSVHVDRSHRTMEAAQIVAAQAGAIAQACALTPTTDVVVAIVEPDMSFGGAWIIPSQRLMAWEDIQDDDGWLVGFSPRARVEDVLAQCNSMENLARRRWEALKRRATRM